MADRMGPSPSLRNVVNCKGLELERVFGKTPHRSQNAVRRAPQLVKDCEAAEKFIDDSSISCSSALNIPQKVQEEIRSISYECR
jgi:hypothetical protein